MEFSSINSIRECLHRGLGITICPEVSVANELKDRTLVKLNWENDYMETTVLMIWHAEKWCSPLLSQFMEMSKSYIQ